MSFEEWAVAVTAVATVAYVVVSVLLWLATKRTADLTHQMFEATQRPYLGIEATNLTQLMYVKPMSTWRCDLIIKNFGNAPAVDVRINWRIEITGSVNIRQNPSEPAMSLQPQQEQRFVCEFKEESNLFEELSHDAAIFHVYTELHYKGLAGNQYRYYEKCLFDPRQKFMIVQETGT